MSYFLSFSQLTFVILTVLAMSVGQILFKMAASEFIFSLNGFINGKFITALFIYFIATIMWLFVLKTTPLRIAYPFMALAFVIVPVFATFLLGEKLHWNTFAGALLIGAGVIIATYR